MYESTSTAEYHQPVSKSTVISGHTRHHHLRSVISGHTRHRLRLRPVYAIVAPPPQRRVPTRFTTRVARFFGMKIIDSLKSIDIGRGLPTAFVISSPFNQVLQLPSEQPGIVYPLDFVHLFSVHYYRWWWSLRLIRERTLSGFLQTEYRLDTVNV
jgi:hypothetical protein